MLNLIEQPFKFLARASFVLVAIYFSCIVAIYMDSTESEAVEADYAIVFGNKIGEDGQPSPRLKSRLLAAKKLFFSGRVKMILVSGGLGKEGFDEAIEMSKFLINSEVPQSKIVIDQEGVTTSLTSKNSIKLIGKEKKVVAVTQQFHVSRSKLSLRNAGFNQVSGYYPDFVEFRDIYSSVREVPAWIKYWVLGL